MKALPHLRLVTTGHALIALDRERLYVRATQLFPDATFDFRRRWVDARMRLGERRPEVDIGIQRIDTSVAARRAPDVDVPLEVPFFLRRFVK